MVQDNIAKPESKNLSTKRSDQYGSEPSTLRIVDYVDATNS